MYVYVFIFRSKTEHFRDADIFFKENDQPYPSNIARKNISYKGDILLSERNCKQVKILYLYIIIYFSNYYLHKY